MPSKPNLYLTIGGLGKTVSFSSIIEDLYNKDKRKICIESGWPEVFYNNPYVASSSFFNENDKFISNSSYFKNYENIYGFDPYYSNFLKKDQHIIHSFQELYGLNIEDKEPVIYFDPVEEQNILSWVNNIKPFILVQFNGGAMHNHPDPQFGKLRNYSYGQELINTIKNNFPTLNIITFDKQQYQNTLNVQIQKREHYFILAKYAEYFIGIDSSLQHFASNKLINKKGIVLWGGSDPKHYGYKKNINLISKYPYRVEITPKEVFENIKKL